MINRLLLFTFFLLSAAARAQEAPAMADDMRADGKIYVVIGVLSIIFICIVVFLVILERRIAKLEEQTKK